MFLRLLNVFNNRIYSIKGSFGQIYYKLALLFIIIVFDPKTLSPHWVR